MSGDDDSDSNSQDSNGYGGAGGNTSFGFGSDMGYGGPESDIGGPGGNGNSYADRDVSAAVGGYGNGSGIAGFNPNMNPEMGGSLSRRRGLNSVDALGEYGRDVNKASAAMQGRTPSLGDRARDFVGWDSPGGLAKSSLANLAVGILGTVVGGPMVGLAAYSAYNAGIRGGSIGKNIGGFLGGAVAGPIGYQVGSRIGKGIEEGGMYPHNPEQASYMGITGTQTSGNAPQSSGNIGDTDSPDYGSRAGVGYQIAPPPPQQSLEMGYVPEDWDEAGFLSRNPEVKRAVANGTWASGYDFNQAFEKASGLPYDTAMDPEKREQLLDTKPGQAVPWSYSGY